MQNKLDTLKSFNKNFGEREINTPLSNKQLFQQLQKSGTENSLIPGVSKQLAEFILILAIFFTRYFGNIMTSITFFIILTAMIPLIIKIYILNTTKLPNFINKHFNIIKVGINYLLIYIIASFSIYAILLKECVTTSLKCDYLQLISIVSVCGLIVPLFSFFSYLLFEKINVLNVALLNLTSIPVISPYQDGIKFIPGALIGLLIAIALSKSQLKNKTGILNAIFKKSII